MAGIDATTVDQGLLTVTRTVTCGWAADSANPLSQMTREQEQRTSSGRASFVARMRAGRPGQLAFSGVLLHFGRRDLAHHKCIVVFKDRSNRWFQA